MHEKDENTFFFKSYSIHTHVELFNCLYLALILHHMWLKRCAFLECLFIPAMKANPAHLSVCGSDGAESCIVQAMKRDALACFVAQ